tara:strand:- start:77146 stop:77400 length:255 start_codon:yes stop_codon:yes gene_type:complete
MNNRCKKILFRAAHRGGKEMDLILGKFAQKYVETLSDENLDHFEALLEEEDPDIYNWIIGKTQPPANAPYLDLLAEIMANKVYE